jgi:flagellar biosynthesis component FlhA
MEDGGYEVQDINGQKIDTAATPEAAGSIIRDYNAKQDAEAGRVMEKLAERVRTLKNYPGEKTVEPAFGLPALWIDAARKEEAMFRGCTVVDPASVLTTHMTEIVRENPKATVKIDAEPVHIQEYQQWAYPSVIAPAPLEKETCQRPEKY